MDTHKSELNEPEFPYKGIRKTNLEELEDENRLYSFKLTPNERLAYLMELNINAFGSQSLLIKDMYKIIKQR